MFLDRTNYSKRLKKKTGLQEKGQSNGLLKVSIQNLSLSEQNY